MKLRSFASSYLIAAVLCIAGLPATLHAASKIGLYADQGGSTCSFAGNAPGLVTAYVVVHPDPNGVHALRFSAPLPACFGATFLYDTPPGGAPVTGSSPTGVQIAFPQCAPYGDPSLALTITYFRNGSTTPCCAFPIEPDPLVGSIEITNCGFVTGTAAPIVAHFNADGSCPCVDTIPPGPPISPGPADGATGVSMTTSLSWAHDTLDIDIASFDVYFGTAANPPFVANVAQDACPLPYLFTSTQYYWRVVVRDTDGNTTSGPTWTFTTRPFNTPPNAPVLTSPANGAESAVANPLLQWTATDFDNDQLRFDVYLGPSPNPVLVSSNQTASAYQPSGLQYPMPYSWYIVVRDAAGAETTGPTWSFTTPPGNHPPNVPTLLLPSNGATFLPTTNFFYWSASDPENNLCCYRIYLGTTNPPGFLMETVFTSENITVSPGTQYYWYVVARDLAFATTPSPVWSFRTNAIPTTPSNPSPPFEAQGQPLNTTITWQSTDADGEVLKYDIYAGNSPTPPLRASNVTGASFDVSSLTAPNQTFFWKIVARDNHGASVTGPLWYFVTGGNPTAVPDMPAELSLGRNHPNPFNPQTIIPYTVPKGTPVHVRIMIFDAAGRRVRVLVDETQGAGAREVTWRGENEAGVVVSSGIYYCVMEAKGKRFTQKLVLLK